MMAQFLGYEDHRGMKKDAVLMKPVYFRVREGEIKSIPCTDYTIEKG
jgi:hypothetical protein